VQCSDEHILPYSLLHIAREDVGPMGEFDIFISFVKLVDTFKVG